MEKEPYYLVYEKRYKTVFEAGADRWGHSPEDEVLFETLKEWVISNNLVGKNIIEFACGEGACGVILSELGCNYHGVDIAPSAVAKTKEAISKYPNAKVDLLDMVKETTGDTYDAALDCMGFHMIVTDSDRKSYLQNAYNSLKNNCPMLFFRESYRDDNNNECIYKGKVNSYEEWKLISGSDYTTPAARTINVGNSEVEVMIPLVPARAKDKEGYIAELEAAGFVVKNFVEMDLSNEILYSATIYVAKP